VDFELKLSQAIALWRDILSHYDKDPVRQSQELQRLMKALKDQLIPP
jgi:hypothetical protein